MRDKDNELYYTITSQTPIFVYGYTKYAQDIACSLTDLSYNVKGYVDIKAEQIDSDTRFPVLLPKDLEEWDSKEIVVILCLQSILTQGKVADCLWKRGINKIIFIPDTIKYNYQMTSEMRQIYQKICMKGNLKRCFIPTYDAMLKNRQSINVVKRFDNYVCILCPIQLIYTGIVDSDNSWQIKDINMYEKVVSVYADKNIIFEKLYSSFFEYMLTGHGNCDTYVEIYSKMSNKSEDDYFRDRVELFGLYEREYEKNFEFFIETAAMAEWNPHGYFNLKDGHHRVTYLQKKGHFIIPVIISIRDFNIYVNAEKEIKLEKFLLENNICKLNNVEISNRFKESNFYNFQVKELIARWKFLSEKINIEENSFLDASDCLGFFAINMSRMHAENVKVISKDDEEEKLLKLIFELTYQNHIVIEKKEDTDLLKQYDVVFARELNEGYNFGKLYEMTKKFYFFMFRRDDAVGRGLIDKLDTEYQKLLEYFDGEKWMESGVIIKDNI